MSPRQHFPPPVCQHRPREAHAAPSPCTARHMNLFPHTAPSPRPAPGAALWGHPGDSHMLHTPVTGAAAGSPQHTQHPQTPAQSHSEHPAVPQACSVRVPYAVPSGWEPWGHPAPPTHARGRARLSRGTCWSRTTGPVPPAASSTAPDSAGRGHGCSGTAAPAHPAGAQPPPAPTAPTAQLQMAQTDSIWPRCSQKGPVCTQKSPPSGRARLGHLQGTGARGANTRSAHQRGRAALVPPSLVTH